MKTQIIILCAVAALAAGCNRSPQGATGSEGNKMEGVSTNDTGTNRGGGTGTNANPNKSGTPESGTKSPDSGTQP